MSEDLQKVRELIVKLFVRRVFQEERTVEQGDHCGWNRMRKKTVDQVMEVMMGWRELQIIWSHGGRCEEFCFYFK